MLKEPCWPLRKHGSPLGKDKLGCWNWMKLLVTQPGSGVKAGSPGKNIGLLCYWLTSWNSKQLGSKWRDVWGGPGDVSPNIPVQGRTFCLCFGKCYKQEALGGQPLSACLSGALPCPRALPPRDELHAVVMEVEI